MCYIKKEIEIIGLKRSKELEALFDSGAGRNYIRKTFRDGDKAEDLGVIGYRITRKIRLADNRIVLGESIAFPKLVVENVPFEKPEMIVMKELVCDVILGSYFMQKLGINLMMGRKQIEWERF